MQGETVTAGLVGCASQKLQRPAPARELYVSQLFRKASAYAELTCDRWYILSAKHGLVHPDQVLEPYDVKLGASARTSPPIHQWAAMVQEQLAAELAGIENPQLIVLAGGAVPVRRVQGPVGVRGSHAGTRDRTAARLADRAALRQRAARGICANKWRRKVIVG